MKSLCPLSAMKFLAVDHPGTACDIALTYENNTRPYRQQQGTWQVFSAGTLVKLNSSQLRRTPENGLVSVTGDFCSQPRQ